MSAGDWVYERIRTSPFNPCAAPILNPLMAIGRGAASALRLHLSQLLQNGISHPSSTMMFSQKCSLDALTARKVQLFGQFEMVVVRLMIEAQKKQALYTVILGQEIRQSLHDHFSSGVVLFHRIDQNLIFPGN